MEIVPEVTRERNGERGPSVSVYTRDTSAVGVLGARDLSWGLFEVQSPCDGAVGEGECPLERTQCPMEESTDEVVKKRRVGSDDMAVLPHWQIGAKYYCCFHRADLRGSRHCNTTHHVREFSH